ncbi:MAG: hypothetical protein CSA36_04075 [Draconibacterium sp.]|nr:MAG: hypothetical protein CSA36_04075 [Draconibacterium sp.]
MKRISFAVILLLIAGFTVVAQNDSKSKSILDQVTENAKTFKTVTAAFVFSMDNDEMGIHEKNEGVLKMKGKKYVVDLPGVGVQIFSDGATIWNYMTDGNQVTISNIDDSESELMDPANLFSIYEKGFNSKFVSEKTVNGQPVYIIDLYPGSDEQDVKKITVTIDKGTMMVGSAELFSTDGNVYSIDVKKFETNKNYNDSEFVFNKTAYPDVEVIDFR